MNLQFLSSQQAENSELKRLGTPHGSQSQLGAPELADVSETEHVIPAAGSASLHLGRVVEANPLFSCLWILGRLLLRDEFMYLRCKVQLHVLNPILELLRSSPAWGRLTARHGRC